MATAQEKIGQAAQTVKDKAIEAKDYVVAGGKTPTAGDKAAEAAQASKDSAIAAAQATKDKGYELAESGKALAATGKDNAGGVLQKTGEQVIGLAQGAADAVKNTLGLGEKKDQK